MKKFLGSIFIILLCVILVGGIYVATQDNTDIPPNSTQSGVVDDSGNAGNSGEKPDNSSSSGTQGDSSGTGNNTPPDSSGNNTPEDTALKNPTNVRSYIADGLEMVSGAAIYLGEAEYEPAIRFTCSVSGAVKSAVDSDSKKSLAFLVAPVEYFDSVNPNNYTYLDWVTEFNKAGKTVIYSLLEEGNFYENGSDYIVRFRLQNVMYKNINRKFVCLLVLETNNGGSMSYKYSAYPAGIDYRSNARSVAGVAAASLNAYTLGMENFNEVELKKLRNYINQSVDCANGKETATDDGSMYAFTTNITAPQNLSVGQSLTIVTTISPNVDIPVWYRSSDEAVIEVDDSGKVIARAKGTAVVGVYVAGETYGITVTVS